MNLSFLRAGMVLSLTLVGTAGCSGGGESSGALTEAEYRKKGNAICKSGIDKVTDLAPPRSPEDIADYLERLFDVSSGPTDAFAALDPPESLRKDHEASVKLSEELEPKFDKIVERVRDAENPQATVMREFRKLEPEIKKSVEVTRRLGLKECLKAPQPGAAPESS